MDTINTVDLDGVASAIVGALPKLDGLERHLSLELYRLLAEGRPVAYAALAQRAGVSLDTVARILSGWPLAFSDSAGHVVGYEGLTLPSAHVSRHRITIGGQTLCAWCAWDTLFLPERLGRTADITSTSPAEERTISLTVTPKQVERIDPTGACVSFLMPGPTGFGRDVITTFCHFIYFFPSRRAGESWTAQHPGTFLLSVAEAHVLARRVNAAQYGDALCGTRSGALAGPGALPHSDDVVASQNQGKSP
jgi:alkylmercury lyase